MNEEAEKIYYELSLHQNQIWDYERKINELKKKLRPLRLKLHKTCKHIWIYDECEPFDSRCKYKCKYCHLPRNINYV